MHMLPYGMARICDGQPLQSVMPKLNHVVTGPAFNTYRDMCARTPGQLRHAVHELFSS